MNFNEYLIELVRERPCLYNAQRKEYRDKEIKNNAWLQISFATKETVKTCVTRWSSLRDRFAREKKKLDQQKRSGAQFSPLNKWEHYEAMLFMQDHVKHRRTATNILVQKEDIIPFVVIEGSDENSLFKVEEDTLHRNSGRTEDTDESTSSSTNVLGDETNLNDYMMWSPKERNEPKPKRRKKDSKHDFQENIIEMLHHNSQSIMEMMASKKASSNQYAAFGNMVAAQLATMNEDEARNTMNMISNCLFGHTTNRKKKVHKMWNRDAELQQDYVSKKEEDVSLPKITSCGTVYCYCGRAQESAVMVQCETCHQWMHPTCVFPNGHEATFLLQDDWNAARLVCSGAAHTFDDGAPIFRHFTLAELRRGSELLLMFLLNMIVVSDSRS